MPFPEILRRHTCFVSLDSLTCIQLEMGAKGLNLYHVENNLQWWIVFVWSGGIEIIKKYFLRCISQYTQVLYVCSLRR